MVLNWCFADFNPTAKTQQLIYNLPPTQTDTHTHTNTSVCMNTYFLPCQRQNDRSLLVSCHGQSHSFYDLLSICSAHFWELSPGAIRMNSTGPLFYSAAEKKVKLYCQLWRYSMTIHWADSIRSNHRQPEREELISQNGLNGWSENLRTYGSQWHHWARSLTLHNQNWPTETFTLSICQCSPDQTKQTFFRKRGSHASVFLPQCFF